MIETLFGVDGEKILEEMMHEEMTSTTQPVKSTDSDKELIQTLSESYKVAESWQVKRQILSVLCQMISYKETSELIPCLTEYRYYAAKKHASTQGCALPPEDSSHNRQRMDPTKLDQLLDFITSSHIVKDLPFGEKKMKLEDGSTITMPNVIRCMGPAAIIEQFKTYCSENDLAPLGK